jgi:hypothetical protein
MTISFLRVVGDWALLLVPCLVMVVWVLKCDRRGERIGKQDRRAQAVRTGQTGLRSTGFAEEEKQAR